MGKSEWVDGLMSGREDERTKSFHLRSGRMGWGKIQFSRFFHEEWIKMEQQIEWRVRRL